MGEESSKPASTPTGAVFLSYASQDAQAAQKICEALRAAGVEVFLDQSELRGGDAWDQKIRHEIHDCALFIPIVSQHTQERLEGYFRHEWNLAIERTHHMAQQKPFLVPVVVDATRDQEAFVPDAFRAVHWTRLRGGETPPVFVERIKRLLSPELSPMSAVSGAAPGLREPLRATWRSKPVLLALAAAFAALAFFVADRFWTRQRTAAPSSASVALTAFAPPPHSIAVLPFVNMSGEKEQEYFSAGLTEEILNSLARIGELQVAARTSSFSFQGEHPDIATVARRLNVGAVLEGSVRRSANTLRITAQLNNALTGFHLWSQTYDRPPGDVLQLQTEIATAVASALKVTLLADTAARIAVGGTRNPQAFDAYLRALRVQQQDGGIEATRAAIAGYSEAVRLDPGYALAFAMRSIQFHAYAQYDNNTRTVVHDSLERAQVDATEAMRLAPELAEAHLAQAYLEEDALNLRRADEEYERAVTLAPGDARVVRWYGSHAAELGHIDAGVKALRQAAVLDPLSPWPRNHLAIALLLGRRYQEAIKALQDARALAGPDLEIGDYDWWIYYQLGDFEKARELCSARSGPYYSGSYRYFSLALLEHKLGRHAEAEAMFARLRSLRGDSAAYDYARIHAQWGNTANALDWLETALRLRDKGLALLRTDPFIDPLRSEPRFQAVMRDLRFPE